MSKLSFRARALDASKPMPIYMTEDLPDLPDYSAINRAVPQMPSGMQKEEECEHHLQRAICTGLIIPTPEVTSLTDVDSYEKIYSPDYKQPRQLIHMQPFCMEQDIPDYDMDSEDEKWVILQNRKTNLTPLQFEEMMDRLEKSSGQTVVTLSEAKALLKEDDDLIIAVFDYWLNKRLKTQHPLLLTVKTEQRVGSALNNPYLAFRRRTEKMQTRKNRKNDETSYEKMLKLRRDLSRAVTLLEMVKKREKTKREFLHLTIEIYEKRYLAQDFHGTLISEISAIKSSRPLLSSIFSNQLGVHQGLVNRNNGKDNISQRKERRPYRRRKIKDYRNRRASESDINNGSADIDSQTIIENDIFLSSEEDITLSATTNYSDCDDDDLVEDGIFFFHRHRNNNYLPPINNEIEIDSQNVFDTISIKRRYGFSLTTINKPSPKCIGLARRRIGRGGRVILDRYSQSVNDLWSSLDFTIQDKYSKSLVIDRKSTISATTLKKLGLKKYFLHFQPKGSFTEENQIVSGTCYNERTVQTGESFQSLINDSDSPLYTFPSQAESICIDIASEEFGSESSFKAEFNINDYFTFEDIADVDSCLISNNENVQQENCRNVEDRGSSQVFIFPKYQNRFTKKVYV